MTRYVCQNSTPFTDRYPTVILFFFPGKQPQYYSGLMTPRDVAREIEARFRYRQLAPESAKVFASNGEMVAWAERDHLPRPADEFSGNDPAPYVLVPVSRPSATDEERAMATGILNAQMARS